MVGDRKPLRKPFGGWSGALTEKQLDALAAFYFCDFTSKHENVPINTRQQPKLVFRLDDVDICSRIRTLAGAKMIRKVFLPKNAPKNTHGRSHAWYTYELTPAGLDELEKHPELWNE